MHGDNPRCNPLWPPLHSQRFDRLGEFGEMEYAPRTEREEKSEFPWKLANKILERFQMSKKCKVTESLSIPLRVFARCGFLFFSLYFLSSRREEETFIEIFYRTEWKVNGMKVIQSREERKNGYEWRRIEGGCFWKVQ